MTTKDKQGRSYAKLSELREGATVQVDGDFTCLKPWTEHEVKIDADGHYVDCADGEHHLNGQADDGEHCIGAYLR